MNLYNDIENPIYDKNNIKKLLEAYSKKYEGFGGFYNQITKTTNKEYGIISEFDKNIFYINMFNKWKNNIINMTKEEFNNLYKAGHYNKDFIKLRNFLKIIPDATNTKQTEDILYGQYNDFELKNAIDKYKWNSNGEYSGWIHCCSRYLTAKKDIYQKVEHRLYINTNSSDTYKFVNEFVNECDKEKIPYYFKFDEIGNRDDTIVIYTSTENITTYINIINNIKLNLNLNINEPPLLTGKINDFIGYGSEPIIKKEEKKASFNEIRSKCIEPIIEDESKKWFLKNLNKTINYQNNNITVFNYLLDKVTIDFINNLSNKYEYRLKLEKFNEKFDLKLFEKKIGYSINEINNEENIKKINIIISKYLVQRINDICTNYDSKPIKIIINKKEFTINIDDIKEVLDKFTINIPKSDSTFIGKIQKEILLKCSYYDIDPKKFCFNKSTINNKYSEKEILLQVMNNFKNKKSNLELINKIKDKWHPSYKSLLYLYKIEELYGNDVLDFIKKVDKNKLNEKIEILAKFQKESLGNFDEITINDKISILNQLIFNEKEKNENKKYKNI